MGQHFCVHLCKGRYPHLTEDTMRNISKHIKGDSMIDKMSRRSTSLLAANASTADAVEAASQVVKSHELSPSASVLDVDVKKSKRCFAKI